MLAPNANEPDLSFCVVWSPLWPITLFLPFIGHTGICDSRGIAHDFRCSHYVGTDGHMAFGPPSRYLKVDTGRLGDDPASQWDDALMEAKRVYDQRNHNLFCDNCHSHVANALNRMPISAYGIHKWDMVKICFLMLFRGSYISWGGFLCQWLPFCLTVTLWAVLTYR